MKASVEPEQSSGPLPWTAPQRFAITRRPKRARVAQLVEHATENRSVGGSIPPPGTISSLIPATNLAAR